MKQNNKNIRKDGKVTILNTPGDPLRQYLLTSILIMGILVVDLSIPLGVASAVPYVTVILASLWMPDKRIPIYLALLCSILTVAGFFLSPPGGELWKVMSNRFLALLVIWITATLVWLRKLAVEKNFNLLIQLEKAKEDIYQATVHSAQHILNNLLNQMQVVKMEAEKSTDFDKNIVTYFDQMSGEAKQLIKYLSEINELTKEEILRSVYPKDHE